MDQWLAKYIAYEPIPVNSLIMYFVGTHVYVETPSCKFREGISEAHEPRGG